jgi:hypothetical protein
MTDNAVSGLRQVWSKKIGPIPVPVIGLALAAAVFYFVMRAKQNGGAGAAADSNGDGTTGDATDDGTAGMVVNPVFTATNPQQVSTGEPTTAQTNESWAQLAIAWLVGTGHDITISQNGIQKYLAGDNLSMEEGALRDLAVQHFGLPPEPLGQIGTVAGPAAPKSPTRQGVPPLIHTVQGARDNTPSELAFIYYGSAATKYQHAIKLANPGHKEIWKTGEGVRIPKKPA